MDTAGLSVSAYRYAGVLIAGLLCGFGGIDLSMAQGAGFAPDMTAGRGFVALAALIFGKWRPFLTLWAVLFFGLLDALAIRLQGVTLGGVEIPVQLIEVMPYVFTVIVLAGFMGKAVPPKHDGVPYIK